MKIINYHQLPLTGFADVEMREIVKDSRLFGVNGDESCTSGLGNLVYIADASLAPGGDTRMHPHWEIDVVTVVLKGRLIHKGSLGNDQEISAYQAQIQRAGAEGFMHNEVNPDIERNHLLQIWLLPDSPGLKPAYRALEIKRGSTTQVYGGDAAQHDALSASTSVEVIRLEKGAEHFQDGHAQIYVAEGSGCDGELEIDTGDLVQKHDFRYKAMQESTLIVVRRVQ